MLQFTVPAVSYKPRVGSTYPNGLQCSLTIRQRWSDSLGRSIHIGGENFRLENSQIYPDCKSVQLKVCGSRSGIDSAMRFGIINIEACGSPD
ncbi:hypothetical protein Trydic_g11063 [Trypoxylus dichotomus]